MRKPTIGIFTQHSCTEVPLASIIKLKLCYANGVDAVFFSIDDLDMENDTVNAFVWTPQGFIREATQLPHLLEYGARTKLRSYFRSRCTIIDDFNLSKKAVNELLIKTEFASSVIPSIYTSVPVKVLSFLNLWNEIIIKPLVGARGEGIVCVKTNADGNYIFTDSDKNVTALNYEKSLEHLIELYHEKTVIVQPRLSFHNKDGRTMDFRINVSKNGQGEWETVFILPRTARDNIVSNVSHGGYASLPEPTIELDYGENAEKVSNELTRIAEKLPPIIEEASACNMLSLGIDVGFDFETLNSYIIEVNYVPQVTFRNRDRYLYLHAEYFAYLARKFQETQQEA